MTGRIRYRRQPRARRLAQPCRRGNEGEEFDFIIHVDDITKATYTDADDAGQRQLEASPADIDAPPFNVRFDFRESRRGTRVECMYQPPSERPLAAEERDVILYVEGVWTETPPVVGVSLTSLLNC